MAKTFKIAKGATLPSVEDIIENNGVVVDLTAADVYLKMREANSANEVLSADAVIVDAADGSVRFDWTPGDTDTEGQYRAWWHIEIGSSVQEQPEFDVVVFSHSPSLVIDTGEIATRVRGYIPQTIDSMLQEGTFTYADFQRHIDDVKEKTFGTIVPAENEGSTYSVTVLDYVAILTTIRLIPVGVDFWNNSLISQAVTGTTEQQSYPDRRKGLWDIQKNLLDQLGQTSIVNVDGEWKIVRRPSTAIPMLSIKQTNAITPDPLLFGHPHFDPTRGVIPPRWPCL